MKYLCIGDRAAVLEKLESFYQKNKKEIFNQIGEIDFLCTEGEACRYAKIEEYPEWNRPFEELTLPLIPERFKVVPLDGKESVVSRIRGYVREKSYDSFIVATEPNAAGNGIYDLICFCIGCKDFPALRFIEHDLTENGIWSSFGCMVPFYEDEKQNQMTYAFRLRSRFEWLVESNVLVGLKRKTGKKVWANIPCAFMIRLVYENNKWISEYTPNDFYTLDIEYKKGFGGSLMDGLGRIMKFSSKEDAEKFSVGLKNTAKLISVRVTDREKLPPSMYSVDELLCDAYYRFGWDVWATSEYLQSLYVKGYISYPFISGNMITARNTENIDNILESLTHIPALERHLQGVTEQGIQRLLAGLYQGGLERPIDAIMPSGKVMEDECVNEEKMLYGMICERVLMWLLPPVVYRETSIIADSDTYKFVSEGYEVRQQGYADVEGKKLESKPLPAVCKDDVLQVQSYKAVKHSEDMPERIDIAGVIKGTRNTKIGNTHVSVGEVKTRVSLIKKIIEEKYFIEIEGRLHLTRKGKDYVDALFPLGIGDFGITGAAEQLLRESDRLKDEKGYLATYVKLVALVEGIVAKIVAMDVELPEQQTPAAATLPPCPACGKRLRVTKLGIGCTGYPDCRYLIRKCQCKKELDEKQLMELCCKGELHIEIYSRKYMRYYPANLRLLDNGNTKVDFEPI